MKPVSIKQSGGKSVRTQVFDTGRVRTTQACWMKGLKKLRLTTVDSVMRTETVETYQRTKKCTWLESFARQVGKLDPNSSLARWAENRHRARWDLADTRQYTYEVELTEPVVERLSKEEGSQWLASNGLFDGLKIEPLVRPLDGPSAA